MTPTYVLFVSNHRHHVDMMAPVARALTARGDARCRVVSLCEFRGLPTPRERLAGPSTEVVSVVPARIRRGPSSPGNASQGQRFGREVMRRIVWTAGLRWRVRACLPRHTTVAVLPNDAAFPYDGIAALLRSRGIPFVLLQEGIRFPLPGVSQGRAYGRGGAVRIAAWGRTSLDYFVGQGVPRARITVTGNPRFDDIVAVDWKSRGRELLEELSLREAPLTLLTNPVDVLGLCSTEQKHDAVRSFLRAVAPLLRAEGRCVAIKSHAGEDAALYRRDAEASGLGPRAVVVPDAPLYPLLGASHAAVVMASTVGLEALMLGVPLGVLELPGVGFAYDYVQRGAARGIRPAHAAEDLAALLEGARDSAHRGAAAYLDDSLAARGVATARVVDVVRRCGEGARGAAP